MLFINPSLMWTIVGLFVALAVGTLVRMVAIRGAAPQSALSLQASLKTWWVLAILLTTAMILGETGILLLIASVGVLGLREFLGLIGWKVVGRPTVYLLFALVPVFYMSIFLGYGEIVREAAPAVFLISLGAIRASLRLVDGYIRSTAALLWGLMLFVYCLSHAYFLITIPDAAKPMVGNVGWFIYLVILTETNDIGQAIVGRQYGKTKITPRISPNKSLEGLIGGALVTMTLAALLAPWLTTLIRSEAFTKGVILSLLAGLLISVFGFLGDINISGIKRDAGVKDGSKLLPGQGGMIDRIDSLTFTAPIFYYFVRAIL